MYQNPYSKLRPATKGPYTEIYLIRHCNPDYSLEKKLGDRLMPLSKFGLKQRRVLTKRLLKMEVDKVYTSSIVRAQETAYEYVQKARKKAFVDAGLDEIDWQHWVRIKYFNMSEEVRRRRFKKYHKLDNELDKMQKDSRRVLTEIYKKNRGKKVLIFSHGNFIKSILTGVMNADILGFLSLEIFQSSISKLIIDSDGYVKIAFVNDAHHLPEPPKKDMFITLVE